MLMNAFKIRFYMTGPVQITCPGYQASSCPQSLESTTQSPARAMRSQSGFTLIELMVAMTLSLFLIGGLLAVFVSNQQTFRLKNQLDIAQDNFRFVTSTIPRFVRQGTGILDTSRSGDDETDASIDLEFARGGTDCVGGAIDSAMTYAISYNSDNKTIQCDVNGASHTLMRNVEDLYIEFGNESADSSIGYLDFKDSQTTDWSSVRAIRISITTTEGETLTFVVTLREKTFDDYG